MANDRKLTGKEHATRAVAAGSQGLLDSMLPATPGLGLLAMRPYFRKVLNDTRHVPDKLKTETPEALINLADKLIRAGGRDPTTGRPVELIFNKKRGFAGIDHEYIKAKGAPRTRDILHLGLGATPESIAHEAGHLTAGGALGKTLSRISSLARTYPAQAAPALLAATALLSDPDKETPAIAKAAPYIGGAQLATILGEEVRANVRAQKLLKRIGYQSSLGQQLGRHALALSYLPRAALLIGAPIGILAGVKAYDEARKKNRPMPVTGLLSTGPRNLAQMPSAAELQEKWAPRFK